MKEIKEGLGFEQELEKELQLGLIEVFCWINEQHGHSDAHCQDTRVCVYRDFLIFETEIASMCLLLGDPVTQTILCAFFLRITTHWLQVRYVS